MKQRQAAEGRDSGGGDAAFHAAILGDDVLPAPILELLREQARRAGIDPRIVTR